MKNRLIDLVVLVAAYIIGNELQRWLDAHQSQLGSTLGAFVHHVGPWGFGLLLAAVVALCIILWRVLVGRNAPAVTVEPPSKNPTTGPTGSSAPADPVEPRQVEITPKELVAFFADRTDAEGVRLVEPFMGGRIKVAGTVKDVMCREHVTALSLDVDGVHVIANFGKERANDLKQHRKDDSVVVAGTLNRVEGSGVILAGSELLPSFELPDDSP